MSENRNVCPECGKQAGILRVICIPCHAELSRLRAVAEAAREWEKRLDRDLRETPTERLENLMSRIGSEIFDTRYRVRMLLALRALSRLETEGGTRE